MSRHARDNARVSVVTPTFRRPEEVTLLLQNLSAQTLLPFEVILVDGAPAEETETEQVVTPLLDSLPFPCRYIRHGGGTAIQRNVGIDAAEGDFVAFIDDDIRLEPDFFQKIVEAFAEDQDGKVGGIVGYRTNDHFTNRDAQRWRWYRRLRLLTTYEPSSYDFKTGYPINANLQPPFTGVRNVDFMTSSCAVWRREVLDSGLRFDLFFRDYGMLEDAHFALMAGRSWDLLQCGDAHCLHLHSPRGRANRRKIGYKCVVNYYYVFQDVVKPLTWRHKFNFFRYQAFELFRMATSALRRRRREDLMEVLGRLEGVAAIVQGRGLKVN
jgi:glycosyltransferase involved in cell wall biosynthesis